jgi:hypothetical protein
MHDSFARIKSENNVFVPLLQQAYKYKAPGKTLQAEEYSTVQGRVLQRMKKKDESERLCSKVQFKARQGVSE